jgi:serine/threonine protein phosphatase PrpC
MALWSRGGALTLSKEPRFLKLSASGATDIGRHREHNEDTVLVRADLNLFIVADGAGGHNAGNVASALATTSIANAYESGGARFVSGGDGGGLGPVAARRLAAAVHRANREIVEIAKSSNKYKGMGTTVVAACFSPESCELHVAHVGDSRCYRLRGDAIEQLTHDHSLFNDVLEMRPEIDDSVLAKLPRHVVTRALGMDDSFRVSVRTHGVAPGDRFLLCSDGVTDALDDDTIASKLGLESLTPEQLVREIIDAALFTGVDDNIAVLVLVAEKANEGATQPTKRGSRPPPRLLIDVPGMADLMASGPEIIITNVDEFDDDDPQITVVPSDGATETLLDAFAGLRMKKPRRNNPGES